MKTDQCRTKEVVKTIQSNASKLPIGFIVGAAIGGGLFLYSNRSGGKQSKNALTNLAKLMAPYVIISILDLVVDNYGKNPKN